jgi:coproporphyrinogen III oxidase-like Fe-S oxidoreductase
VDDGLVEAGTDAYQVTATGRWFLRNIAMTLDAYLPRQRTAAAPVFSRTL